MKKLTIRFPFAIFCIPVFFSLLTISCSKHADVNARLTVNPDPPSSAGRAIVKSDRMPLPGIRHRLITSVVEIVVLETMDTVIGANCIVGY